ncbi:MAG: DUF1573 domain-containing protein [Flavobacteriales bacterium]
MNSTKILPLALVIALGACKKSEVSSSEIMSAEKVEQAKERRQKELNKEQKENEIQSKKTKIAFDKEIHDFGSIPYENQVETTFKIKNVGENPLIILKAEASCGCTVPEKPTQPILPGEEGDLKVAFKPNKEGVVSKKVTLTTNTEAGKEFVTVKANVAPKKQK